MHQIRTRTALLRPPNIFALIPWLAVGELVQEFGDFFFIAAAARMVENRVFLFIWEILLLNIAAVAGRIFVSPPFS